MLILIHFKSGKPNAEVRTVKALARTREKGKDGL